MKTKQHAQIIFLILLGFGIGYISRGYNLNTIVKEAFASPQDTYYLERQIKVLEEGKQMCENVIQKLREIPEPEIIPESKPIVRILKGELEGKEEQFLASFSKEILGNYVMAVICSESGCGLKPCAKHNYSGIMENGRCKHFDSIEDYIDGVKTLTGKYFN